MWSLKKYKKHKRYSVCFTLLCTIFSVISKNLSSVSRLTHYSTVLLFYTPWKHQKTFTCSDVFRGYQSNTGMQWIKFLWNFWFICLYLTFLYFFELKFRQPCPQQAAGMFLGVSIMHLLHPPSLRYLGNYCDNTLWWRWNLK